MILKNTDFVKPKNQVFYSLYKLLGGGGLLPHFYLQEYFSLDQFRLHAKCSLEKLEH